MKQSLVPPSSNLEGDLPSKASQSRHSGHKTLQNVHPPWWSIDPFLRESQGALQGRLVEPQILRVSKLP